MFRHTVIWKIKEDTTREQVEMLKRESESLKGIKGVISLTFNIDPVKDVNYDIMLDAMYVNQDAYEAYVTDPIHVTFGKKLRPLVCEKITFDTEA